MNNFKNIRRIINKGLRIISIEKQLALWDAMSVVDDCDIVFSVGGDIYTIPQYIIDNNKAVKHSAIVEFGKIVTKYIPMVIWGASIGPFGEKLDVKNYYLDHFKDINKIFCREAKTFNYLKSNGIISNLELCPDPAFYVRPMYDNKIFTKGKKTRIGLNLSPLSVREQIGEEITSIQRRIVETIKELCVIPNSEIVLVPHVISPISEKDNDLTYLKNIYNIIPIDYRKNVSILEDAKDFLETKNFLKTCDIVIAARMHCAINAVMERVPTIFLYYSQKGLGMAQYIYGNSNWAIKLTDIDKQLKNKTIEMLSKRESISKELKERISNIQRDEAKIIELLKKLI